MSTLHFGWCSEGRESGRGLSLLQMIILGKVDAFLGIFILSRERLVAVLVVLLASEFLNYHPDIRKKMSSDLKYSKLCQHNQSRVKSTGSFHM